jgi:hypothetical protein
MKARAGRRVKIAIVDEHGAHDQAISSIANG